MHNLISLGTASKATRNSFYNVDDPDSGTGQFTCIVNGQPITNLVPSTDSSLNLPVGDPRCFQQ